MFFRPERHQECPRSTKTACVSLRQWPRTDSCFHRVGQTAGSKLQVSSSAAAPPATAPCKSQRLTSSCPPPATATAPRMLQTTLVPGHPQDCSITPSIGKNGPPRVTSECVSGHVNCTWPHDIRAQPCKHRRLKGRSRNHKVLPRSPYPLESVHMSSSLTLFLDKTPFFT